MSEQPEYGIKDPRAAAALEVADAWNNPGPVPAYHRAAQTNLWNEWPTLAAAVEKLAEQYDRKR